MADAWSAFDGTAATSAPAAVIAAPSPAAAVAPRAASSAADDPWAAFDGTPAPAPAAQSATRAAAPAASEAPAAPHDAKTGYLANFAAGANSAAAQTLGLPVDLATGAINLGIRGVNAATGATVPTINDPVGGSGTFRRAMGLVGANPDDVRPDGIGQEIARSAGAGAASAVLPGGIARGLGEAGVLAAPTVARIVGATGDVTAGNAALGATSGVAADQAAQHVSEPYKPLAALAGGLAGVGVPLAAVAAARGAAGSTLGGLADYAAPVVGRQNALVDAAGTQFASEGGVPLSASAGQARLAGNRLADMVSDPVATRNALANLAPSDVPGANPTSFQALRDPKLGVAERSIARTSPDAQDFLTRAAAQNDARVGAIRNVAPDANTAALPTSMQQRAADIDATESARVASVQRQTAADFAQKQAEADAQRAAAQQQTDAQMQQVRTMADQHVTTAQQRAADAVQGIGGDLSAGSDAQVGAALRTPGVDAANAARKVRGDLYDAIDPNGTLNVGISPLKSAHAQLQQEATPFSAPRSAGESGIMDQLGQAPDVVPFAALRDLQKRLTGGIRAARSDPERQEEMRRMSILLDGVHGSMADAANAADLPAAEQAATSSALASPSASPAPSPGPSVGSDVFTPSGSRVGVRYELADPASLITSHDDNMRPNPAYPPELQPRDRSRTASELQVQNIRNGLQPERLGASNTIADGAPVVGPDNFVESGNARTMALRQVMADNGPRAQEYRDWLASQGHDTSANPNQVLIRRRTTDLTPEQRVALTREGNAPTTLAMSATERAAKDAGNLSDDVLQRYQHGPALGDAGNRDFVRNFAQNVVDPAEQGSFATGDGTLSKEGAARIEAALVHRAYGDSGLTAALSEETDPQAKVLSGAMRDAAGPMARLKAGIDAGAVDPQVDLAPHLIEATHMVQAAKRQKLGLADAVGQQDAFNQLSPQADAILRAAYGDNLTGRMSQNKMADLLAEYAKRAEQQTAGASLFDDKQSAQQVLDGVAAQYGKSATQGVNVASDAAPARAVNGQGGGGPWRSGPSAPRQAASGVGGGEQPSASILPQAAAAPAGPVSPAPAPALTANFDAAARQRLLAANAQHAEDVQTFRKAQGVGQMLAPGPTKGTFKSLDSQVPNLIVRAGPVGADVAKAYIKAGGTPEALSDAAAFSLRQAAMKDGVLDPAKYAAWAQQRQSFLSQIPDAAARFGAAADASRAAQVATKTGADAIKAAEQASGKAMKASDGVHVKALKDAAAVAQGTINDATAARASAIKANQDSVVGKFLGSADPVMQVATILRGKTSVADMENLSRLTASDPDARAGLQRAVADHILTELKSDAPTIGDETALSGNALQKFLRKSGPALEKIMSPEQMRSLHAVGESLAQSRLSESGTRVGTGSDTAQIAAHAGGTFLSHLSAKLFGPVTGGGVGSAIGAAVAGPAGAAFGGSVGSLAGQAVQSMREAGIKNVDHLVAQALLNPALMRTLMTTATAKNTSNLMGALTSQVRRLSLVSAARGYDDQQRTQQQQLVPMRRNTLLH